MVSLIGSHAAITSLNVEGDQTYIGQTGSVVVTSKVEVPNVNALNTGGNPPGTIETGGSIDIGAHSVTRTFTVADEGDRFTYSDFNGTIFNFSGRSIPEIVGASIASTNISGLDDSALASNSTQLAYNVSGLQKPYNEVAYFNVNLDLDQNVLVTSKVDGSHVIVGDGSDLILISSANDKMTGGGDRDDFVFTAGCGHETVTDFVVGGAGRDTLDLTGCGFDSIADVLRHTTMQGANAVIHDQNSDSIKLVGITKAQLSAHRGDISV